MKSVVLGLGVSGRAAAKFLVKLGRSVMGIDDRYASIPLEDLQRMGVQLQSGSNSLNWSEIQELIVSPGVSSQHPIYLEALKRQIPIRAEAELALPYLQKKLVAITGTNGKTTVTLLVEHILNQSGIPAKALGNVGVALCDYVLCGGSEEVCVVELSSYQLETMKTPVFESATLLNITPDHLDRYSSMEEYAKWKFHLASLVKPQGSFFVQKSAALAYGQGLVNPCVFGWDSSCDVWTDKKAIFEGETVACLLPIVYKDKGAHVSENAMAAWGLCRHLGVSAVDFTKGLETFRSPPHRIEWVREINGVSYYDDSKGTNIDAVIQAVSSMQSEVILLVGGVDKGASYLPWKESFANKVTHLVAMGQASEKIWQELHPYFAVTRVDSLESAVNLAAQLAKTGDCVLLSPGCSSFDMFRDYAHRGEEFKKQVERIYKERNP